MDDPEDDGRAAKREAQRLKQAVAALVARLDREASDRVSKRSKLEEEWIADLEQFHGRYDAVTMKRLIDAESSRVFMNYTRPKTVAMAAKIMGILFPTDDNNWAIEPTPVPSSGGEPMEDDTAAQACELMSEEMDDQLTECGYQAQCRDVIDDACKLGTGVMEGPIVNDRVRRGWKQDETGGYALQMGGDPRPAYRRVDPWAFFPDPDARSIEENESTYVRYLWNAKQLRKFARLPDVDADAVRRLLTLGPRDRSPSYLSRLRTATGEASGHLSECFTVWKFSGALSAAEMRDIALATGDAGTAKEMEAADPLDEAQAVIWFCQGEVLKFAIYPMDSGECTYSVFCLEKDEASIWGYGIPRMTRDPQSVSNASWRMLMDNGGLATGDQIIMNQNAVTPADGSPNQAPRKVWYLTDQAAAQMVDVRSIFSTFSTNSHIDKLVPMIEFSQRQMDLATSLPQMAEAGEAGATMANTPVGTAMIMAHAANVVFGRIIKAWDDDVTTPNIRRLYDWNMQHSTREEIKGDFDVKPRGASVLLVREVQSQNLVATALAYAGTPWGGYIKGLEQLRETYRSLQLDHEQFVMSDEEAAAKDRADAEAAMMMNGAGAPSGKTPEEIDLAEQELSAKIAVAEADRTARIEVAQLQRDTEMMKLAQQGNMKLDELEMMIAEKDKDRRSKERTVAAELAARASEKEPLNQTQIANT